MTDQDQQREELQRKAGELLSRLSPEERERLLIDCWMAHDARWFAAAMETFGRDAANTLNHRAVYELGKGEARRLARTLHLSPVTTRDDYLLAQQAFITLLGPHLLDYDLTPRGDDAFDIHIQRCFAHQNVTRAGIADGYRCGILPRVAGWLDALGVDYDMTPTPSLCLKARGGECIYRFGIGPGRPAAS